MEIFLTSDFFVKSFLFLNIVWDNEKHNMDLRKGISTDLKLGDCFTIAGREKQLEAIYRQGH